MLIWPDCIPCILKMSLGVVRLVMEDEVQVRRCMEEILTLNALRGQEWQVIPPRVVRDVWLKISEISGQTDPLKGIKAEQNRRALQIYPLAKELIFKSHDPFLVALKFAIAGNAWDAMVNMKEERMDGVIQGLDRFHINFDNVYNLKERLKNTRTLIYLSDNCGEIVFDKLFLEVLRQKYDLEVTVVTRTLPVLNDATFQDACSVGLDGVAHLMENGVPEPIPSTLLEKVSPEVKALIQKSDLLISKGVGNHDSLTEEKGLKGKISFLFHGKCHPCCSLYKVPLDALIVYNF